VPIGRYLLRAFDASSGELRSMAINNACMVFGSTLRHAHVSDVSHASVKGQHAAVLFQPPETMLLEAINGECTLTPAQSHPVIVAALESEKLRLPSADTRDSVKVSVGSIAKKFSSRLCCFQLAESELVFLIQDQEVMTALGGKSSGSTKKRKEEEKLKASEGDGTLTAAHGKKRKPGAEESSEDRWGNEERAWRGSNKAPSQPEGAAPPPNAKQPKEPSLGTKKQKAAAPPAAAGDRVGVEGEEVAGPIPAPSRSVSPGGRDNGKGGEKDKERRKEGRRRRKEASPVQAKTKARSPELSPGRRSPEPLKRGDPPRSRDASPQSRRPGPDGQGEKKSKPAKKKKIRAPSPSASSR